MKPNCSHLCFIFLSLLISTNSFSQRQSTFLAHFDSGEDALSKNEKSRLSMELSAINNSEVKRIEVFGYCDDVGNSTSNLELSIRRAEYVKRLLVRMSFSAGKVEILEGKGEQALEKDTDTSIGDARSKNRRVEIRMVFTDEEEKASEEAVQTVEKLSLKDMETGDKMVLKNILFKGGTDEILNYSFPEMRHLLSELENNPKYKIRLEGHICCQNNGLEGKNDRTGRWDLSVARAQAVYDYLIKKGISPSRLEYVGLKSAFPLGGEILFDRRVEVVITNSGN